jgi:phosphatidylglycerol:prolipoprotein diacylglycerol transferase
MVDGQPWVPYRHPSQIYEGLGEGVALGIGLWIVWRLTRHRPLGSGVYAVLFLLGYAVIRWSLENVRQPDAQLGDDVFLGMTMGQTLSCGMVVFAFGIWLWTWMRRAKGTVATN